MQSETGFLSSYQLKSYVASKSRLKLAARAVLSADAGLLVYVQTKSPEVNTSFYATSFSRMHDVPTATYLSVQYDTKMNSVL